MATNTTNPSSAGSNGDALSASTLLVVDDDAELRELTGEYLAQQGSGVVSAEDATSMDAILAEQQIDLVILDLMLPGEDGLSIAKRLKAATSIPIIMVSAQGEDCLLYTSPSPRDRTRSRMPSSA